MPGKTTPATGPPRRGCQSVRPALSTAAATGDTAADSGHRFRAGTPCGNMPPGHPQPGNPPRFRADSLSNGHPGNRGKRPPHPCHPAGQDAAGPGRFPARHRHTPGHRATLAASVSAGKPPPGGARCRARPPPPPGHPAGAVSQSGPPSAPPPPPGTPPPETLSSPPGAVSPGQQRPPIPATRDSLNRGKTAGRPASTRPKKRKNRPPPHKTGPPSAAKTCLTH